ncbi:MAG: 4Fe-4S dicluster domain-containing protein [Candidatus Asgardarchaeia archaeon]
MGIIIFPDKCRHCNPAPCMQVCPTGAITRQSEFDTVIINEEKCIDSG